MADPPDRERCGFLLEPCRNLFSAATSGYYVSKDGVSRFIGVGMIEELDAASDEEFARTMTAVLQLDHTLKAGE
jgi:hypothetical protein